MIDAQTGTTTNYQPLPKGRGVVVVVSEGWQLPRQCVGSDLVVGSWSPDPYAADDLEADIARLIAIRRARQRGWT